MTYTISLVEKTKPRILETFTTDSLEELAEKITTHDWAPGTFSDSHRHAESWTGTDLLIYDVDEGLTLAEAEKRLDESKLQYVLLTSRNHQKEKRSGKKVKPACDRFRIILPLEARITEVSIYRATWAAWMQDLCPEADKAAKDPARFFYHSPSIVAGQNEGPCARSFDLTPKSTKPATEQDVLDAEKTLAGWPMPERYQRAWKYLHGLIAAGGSAIEGEGGDAQTLYVARAVGWDFGLSESLCYSLLLDVYNPKCEPEWDEAALAEKVHNAYSYSTQHLFGRKLIQNAKDEAEREAFLAAHRTTNPTVTALAPPEVPVEEDQKDWSPQILLTYTVPVLDEAFALLRTSELNGPPTTLILKVDERNQACALARPQAAKDMARRLAERFAEVGVTLTEKTADNTMYHWENHARLLPQEPAALTYADDDRISWCRLKWKPAPGDCSAWNEFLDRCSDPEAVRAYVGACFTPEHSDRQALYLKGNGRDGKSTFIRVLRDAMGSGGSAINDMAVTKSERFFLSAIFGKRAVFYGDCRLSTFCKSSPYRAIVSGDPQSIEFKGQAAFTANVQSKLIIGSNLEPQIEDTEADRSRLILIEVSKSKNQDDPGWEARLRAQLPAFVHECLRAFQEKCPNGGMITLSDETLARIQDATDDYDAPFADLVDRHFEYDPEGQVTLQAFRDAIRNEFDVNDSGRLGKIRRFLERRGVKRCRVQSGPRFFRGLKLRGGGKSVVTPLGPRSLPPNAPKPLPS